MDRSTIIALLSVGISIISLSVSAAAFWLTWLKRGRLFMTKPTIIFFGYDTVPRQRTPKIFLRALLYSTSARGQVVEAMYVKLRRGDSQQIFSFWGYGETNKLTAGSGLFVGQAGIALNHHFVLPVQHTSYEFVEGPYSIHVLARVVGKSRPISLDTISLTLSRIDARTYLAGGVGILFELDWETGKYHGREYTVQSRDEDALDESDYSTG
jgi:hypothetical protein